LIERFWRNGRLCLDVEDILEVVRGAMSNVMSRTRDAQLRKMDEVEDREGIDAARR
jgi:hypothetical protein